MPANPKRGLARIAAAPRPPRGYFNPRHLPRAHQVLLKSTLGREIPLALRCACLTHQMQLLNLAKIVSERRKAHRLQCVGQREGLLLDAKPCDRYEGQSEG